MPQHGHGKLAADYGGHPQDIFQLVGKGVDTRQWFDQTKGVRGGYFAKTAVSEVQEVIAAETGYLYDTPIG